MYQHIDRTVRNLILALDYWGTHKYEGLFRCWFAAYE